MNFRIVILAAVALYVGGCGAKIDQTQLLASANQGFALAENAATDLRAAGLIGDTDWNHTQSIAGILRTALDTWGANINTSAGNIAMQTFFSTLPQLLQVVKDFSPARKMAATRPVTHASNNYPESYRLRTVGGAGSSSGRADAFQPPSEGIWRRAG